SLSASHMCAIAARLRDDRRVQQCILLVLGPDHCGGAGALGFGSLARAEAIHFWWRIMDAIGVPDAHRAFAVGTGTHASRPHQAATPARRSRPMARAAPY